MSLDGKLNQITRFSPTYQLDLPLINWASWSPDGKQLAMWVYEAHGDKLQLIIVDMVTHELINTCIETNVLTEWIYKPVWSPDGQQIVLYNYQKDSSQGGTNPVILVDWKNGYAAQIAENMISIAWMKAP